MGKFFVEDTGIFVRVTPSIMNGEDMTSEEWLDQNKTRDQWLDPETHLSKIEKCLRSADASEALMELIVLRQGIERLQPIANATLVGRVIVAALEVGFAYCVFQIRDKGIERSVKQKRSALKKGPKFERVHAAVRRKLIRAEAECLWRSGRFTRLSDLRNALARREGEPLRDKDEMPFSHRLGKLLVDATGKPLKDKDNKPIVDEHGKPIKGFLMPKLTVIEQATSGLKTQRKRKTKPKLRSC